MHSCTAQKQIGRCVCADAQYPADVEICDNRIYLVNFNSDFYARINLKLSIVVLKDLQERFFS